MRLFNSKSLHEQQRHTPPSYRGRAQGPRYGGRGARAVDVTSQAIAGHHEAAVESDRAREILQRLAEYDRAA